MYRFPNFCQRQLKTSRNLRCVAGRFLPIVAVLMALVWQDTTQASCSHYVRDRLHPVGASESLLESLELTWDFVHRQPIKHEPCRGPGCRAPELPATPTSLSVVIVPESNRTTAVPVAWNFRFARPTRPVFARPSSEGIGVSPVAGIFKPPC